MFCQNVAQANIPLGSQIIYTKNSKKVKINLKNFMRGAQRIIIVDQEQKQQISADGRSPAEKAELLPYVEMGGL